MDELPLQNVLPSAQVAATHPARLVAVRKAAFDQLAPTAAPSAPTRSFAKLQSSPDSRPEPVVLQFPIVNSAQSFRVAPHAEASCARLCPGRSAAFMLISQEWSMKFRDAMLERHPCLQLLRMTEAYEAIFRRLRDRIS